LKRFKGYVLSRENDVINENDAIILKRSWYKPVTIVNCNTHAIFLEASLKTNDLSAWFNCLTKTEY
jgi:hypothetical protein